MTKTKKQKTDKFRPQVIARDNGRCRGCGIADEASLHCDHIVPESKGGETTLANLQALCGVCNGAKGSTNIGELEILPPIEGFGDKQEVTRKRAELVELVEAAKATEIASVMAEVASWRASGVRGIIIYNRLCKRFPKREVDKFMVK